MKNSGGVQMETIKKSLAEHNHYLGDKLIRSNKEIRQALYSPITFSQEQTPFDYIECLWVSDGLVCINIFIEPVGTITFTHNSLEELFSALNAFFESQPEDMKYAFAGHKIQCYARNVRKGHGIHLKYLSHEDVWNIDIYAEDKKPTSSLTLDNIKKGQDLFDYIQQKNRVDILILSHLSFMSDGLEDTMMGEIVHVEPYMPDLFKVVIDLTKFEDYNQHILSLSDAMESYKQGYPRNRMVEYYIDYSEDIQETEDIELLKKDDIERVKQEALHCWTSEFEGDLIEYRENKRKSLSE